MADIDTGKMLCLNFNGLKLEMMSADQNYTTALGRRERTIDSALVFSAST